MCILEGCNYKGKYGEYCYKHRRNYLIDSNNPTSKTIILNRWTNKCSDYLKQDIIHNLRDPSYFCNEGTNDSLILVEKSKQELFLLLTKKINSLKKYNEKDIQRIIQIQTKIKNKGNNKIHHLRG